MYSALWNTAQCGNYKNLLSHFFDKNSVKTTFPNKITKSLIWRKNSPQSVLLEMFSSKCSPQNVYHHKWCQSIYQLAAHFFLLFSFFQSFIVPGSEFLVFLTVDVKLYSIESIDFANNKNVIRKNAQFDENPNYHVDELPHLP